MPKIKIKTGQKAPISGQYRSGRSKKEITMVKGKKAPPYADEGRRFTLIDKTKHKK
jgi:hypothetical protein